MYRPTVRYDDVFRDYVDVLFHSTQLDRNQIIRGALFSAAHSNEFMALLEPYKKKDVPLSSPKWQLNEGRYWLEQSPKIKERGKDVNVKRRGASKTSEASHNDFGRGSKGSGRIEQVAGSAREISSERIEIRNKGGITFTVN